MKKTAFYPGIILTLMLTLLFTCVLTSDAAEPRITAETDPAELSLGEEVTVTVRVMDYDLHAKGIDMLEIHIPIDTTYLEYVEGSETSFASASSNQILTAGFGRKTMTFKFALVDVTEPITAPEDGRLFCFRLRMVGTPEENTQITLAPTIHILSADDGENKFTKTENARFTLKKQEVKPKKQYTVTFIMEKTEEILAVRTVNEGDAAQYPWTTAAEAPEIEGMTFSGWVGDASAVYTDLTVKARYTENRYTITFIGFDGSILTSQTVKWKENAIPPEIPEIEGYRFTGFSDSFENVTSAKTVRLLYEQVVPEETATTEPSATPENSPSAEPTPVPTENSGREGNKGETAPGNEWIIYLLAAALVVVSGVCAVLIIRRKKA